MTIYHKMLLVFYLTTHTYSTFLINLFLLPYYSKFITASVDVYLLYVALLKVLYVLNFHLLLPLLFFVLSHLLKPVLCDCWLVLGGRQDTSQQFHDLLNHTSP